MAIRRANVIFQPLRQVLLSVNEIAARKGVSVKTVYSAFARKRLPRSYHRGRLVVNEVELALWTPGVHRGGYPKGKKLSNATKAKIGQGQKHRWAQLRKIGR